MAANELGTVSGHVGEFTTLAPIAPTAMTGVASGVTHTGATLNASVEPNEGEVTNCKFEYGPTSEYGKSTACSSLPGSGSNAVPVSAPLSGLEPGARYHFRIVVTSAGGTAKGDDGSFETLPPSPPTVVTENPTAIGYVVATLHGSVDPNESAVTSCRFEYGIAPTYGKTATCSSLPGSGAIAVPVSAPLTGLSPGTAYSFRLVATNAAGTGYGQKGVFSTEPEPQLELGRCIKLSSETPHGYTDSGCTSQASAGKYEWEPWPVSHAGFRFKNGAALFETPTRKAVRCSNTALSGSYLGPSSASVDVVFAGCEATSGLTEKCQSEGAQAGEIDVVPVTATLEVIEASAKPEIGWGLKPSLGTTLMRFRCGSSAVTVDGGVIAPLTGVKAGTLINTMTVGFGIKLSEKHGKQGLEALEGGPKETLSLITGTTDEQVALKLKGLMNNEELLEIRETG